MNNSTKKTLLLVAKIALHVLGIPLLFVLAFVLNLKVIKGGLSYGAAAFAALIFTAVIALIYYLAYFLVRTKKGRSIRNQHIIVAIVIVCSMTGLWMLLDAFVPEPLETATSNTIRWEDLSDNWEERGEVNANLLKDYITLNYNMGRLPIEGKSLDDYLKEGTRNEKVADLMKRDFLSIDHNGYATFAGPSIDYAQMDRMTIPVLLHLLLDKRQMVELTEDEVKKGWSKEIPVLCYYSSDPEDNEPYLIIRASYKVGGKQVRYVVIDNDLNVIDEVGEIDMIVCQNGKYVAQHKRYIKVNGKDAEEIDSKECNTKAEAVAWLQAESYIEDDDVYYVAGFRYTQVNWDVLDMLGTPMEMQLLTAEVMEGEMPLIGGTIGEFVGSDEVLDILGMVSMMIAEDKVLGSPIYVGIDVDTGTVSLTPSNDSRGTLDYMRQAWLNSNDLLFIIVGFFSTRTLFYIYAPVMALIAILLGVIREQEAALKGKEEEEKAEDASQEEEPKQAPQAEQENEEDEFDLGDSEEEQA